MRGRRERPSSNYLSPPPLTELQLKEIYGSNPQAECRERVAAYTALKSIRGAVKKHCGIEEC